MRVWACSLVVPMERSFVTMLDCSQCVCVTTIAGGLELKVNRFVVAGLEHERLTLCTCFAVLRNHQSC